MNEPAVVASLRTQLQAVEADLARDEIIFASKNEEVLALQVGNICFFIFFDLLVCFFALSGLYSVGAQLTTFFFFFAKNWKGTSEGANYKV